MRTSVELRGCGMGRSSRTCSCSRPPCAEIVSDRTRWNVYSGAEMTSIKVPPLGESIVEATVSKWLKNEGDAVAAGDTLVELEADKITVEVPSVTGGVLKKRFAKEGDVVKLDQPLAEIDEKADGGRSSGAAALGEKGGGKTASSRSEERRVGKEW